MKRHEGYERLGLSLAGSLEVVPRELFNDVSNKSGLLEEYIADLIITIENGNDITSWVKSHIAEYKDAINWQGDS